MDWKEKEKSSSSDWKSKNSTWRKFVNLYKIRKLYPPKITSLDYNRFSPYTPIPYHNSTFTKYQHHHIDLVGYLNEKQNNITNYYFARYNDYTMSDSDLRRIMDWHNPYEMMGIQSRKHDHHGHGHH